MTTLHPELFGRDALTVRHTLLAERALLLESLDGRDSTAEPARSDVPDGIGETEHLVTAEQLVVSARLDTLTRATLEGIDAALDRLDTGTYGICTGCSEPIPSERLDAMPAAEMCVPCKHERELYRR